MPYRPDDLAAVSFEVIVELLDHLAFCRAKPLIAYLEVTPTLPETSALSVECRFRCRDQDSLDLIQRRGRGRTRACVQLAKCAVLEDTTKPKPGESVPPISELVFAVLLEPRE